MAKTFEIPRLEEHSTVLVSFIDKEREIGARLKALETEADALRYDADPATSAADERLSRAAAILGDMVLPVQKPSASERSDRSRAIQTEIADLRSAMDVLCERIRTERSRAAEAVCAAVKAPYEAALKETAIALAKARASYASAIRITDGLWDDQGITWNTHLIQPHNLKSTLSNADRSDTHADVFIRDIVAAGVVKAAEVQS